MIQRDDLVAAASVGLLQYRQIDPLLIFLLQRDVRAQRAALMAQPSRTRPTGTHLLLSYMAGMLAIVTSALFAVLFTARAAVSPGIGALLIFTVLYAVAAIAVASWFKRRGLAVPLRLLAALAVALVPLAVYGLQHVTN